MSLQRKYVWEVVLNRYNVNVRLATFQDVQTGESFVSRIRKIAGAAVFYYTWRARNRKVFQQVQTEVESVVHDITKDVVCRVLYWKKTARIYCMRFGFCVCEQAPGFICSLGNAP